MINNKFFAVYAIFQCNADTTTKPSTFTNSTQLNAITHNTTKGAIYAYAIYERIRKRTIRTDTRHDWWGYIGGALYCEFYTRVELVNPVPQVAVFAVATCHLFVLFNMTLTKAHTRTHIHTYHMCNSFTHSFCRICSALLFAIIATIVAHLMTRRVDMFYFSFKKKTINKWTLTNATIIWYGIGILRDQQSQALWISLYASASFATSAFAVFNVPARAVNFQRFWTCLLTVVVKAARNLHLYWFTVSKLNWSLEHI